MKNPIFYEKAQVNKRIYAYLLDILSFALSSVVIFFIVLYSIFVPCFDYNKNKETINEYNIQYNLNYGYGEKYTKYEEAIKKIYFVDFKDEIVRDFNVGGKNLTIEHIYNFNVLMLPTYPTTSDYSGNGLFKYETNSDGSYNVDKIATRIEGSGKTYEKNLSDLFYQTYSRLPEILKIYNKEYKEANRMNLIYERNSRIVALVISAFILFYILPLINKNGSTIFEKLFKIGYVNNKDKYKIKFYKVLLRPIVSLIIPFIGAIWFTKYSIILLCIAPIFINFLFMVFNKRNADIPSLILSLNAVDLENTIIFKNENDEENYILEHNKEEDFSKKLEVINAISEDNKNL